MARRNACALLPTLLLLGVMSATAQERDYEIKKQLMAEIFKANLELKRRRQAH